MTTGTLEKPAKRGKAKDKDEKKRKRKDAPPPTEPKDGADAKSGDEPKTEERPKTAAKLIEKFEKQHAKLIEKCRISAEHTATAGWKKLYGDHQESVKKAAESLANRLASLSRSVRDGQLDKEVAKALSDAKKDLEALAERQDSFDTETVKPVRDPVDKVRDLVLEAERAASFQSSDEGMFAPRDLVSKMRNAIAGWPSATWDAATGTVTVKD